MRSHAARPIEESPANESSSSIGTNSPLIQRLRQKIQRKPLSSHQSTVEDLEETLRICYNNLKDDVAGSARFLLEEAKTATNTLFMDQISPWKSIDGGQPASTQKSWLFTKIETIVSNLCATPLSV